MTKTPLHREDVDDLSGLAARVLRARLTAAEWREVAAALTKLRSTLDDGSNQDVLRAAGAFDDLLSVRVRAEPGTPPVDDPPDDVVDLIHDVDTAVRAWLAGVPPNDDH
ncbi:MULTISPECIES: CATRA system-associated protein [Micromonospora]|uniref:CATRA system-associated protein n=1 Tax=Micromonospora TaxID=1873 RepID=UPI002E12A2EB|nr:hypothetical protein OG712_14250 [Micromonospora maris]